MGISKLCLKLADIKVPRRLPDKTKNYFCKISYPQSQYKFSKPQLDMSGDSFLKYAKKYEPQPEDRFAFTKVLSATDMRTNNKPKFIIDIIDA